jgi:benzoyl-CoA-dihydrodiol lyase
VEFERDNRLATITLRGPDSPAPADASELTRQGAASWLLQIARELDDAILDIRLNALEVATIVFKSPAIRSACSSTTSSSRSRTTGSPARSC